MGFIKALVGCLVCCLAVVVGFFLAFGIPLLASILPTWVAVTVWIVIVVGLLVLVASIVAGTEGIEILAGCFEGCLTVVLLLVGIPLLVSILPTWITVTVGVVVAVGLLVLSHFFTKPGSDWIYCGECNNYHRQDAPHDYRQPS